MFARLATLAPLLLAAPAAATIVVAPRLGAPDPGPLPGERLVVSFDAPNAAGFTWDGAPATRTGSLSGVAAAPAGVSGRFGFVSTQAGRPAIATLRTPALRSISLYWGSVDAHNRVQVLGTNGQTLLTLNGNQFTAASGNWNAALTNRRVQFRAMGGTEIGGLRFIARGTAFEFDSIAAGAVPEPSSWALLIAGFGLTGTMARRQRRQNPDDHRQRRHALSPVAAR
ncbi:hypothetical protein CAP39_12240 [Sphingomonas sp. IBVSS1]|nr:hypothetical protein CAP39_12240 [Sphingomonas sp. IBVSS1]